jgi:peptidyl-prolyl cis-trans isomerase A (cyclophilin A)
LEVGYANQQEPLRAVLVTSRGRIVVQLFEDTSPRTVEAFVGWATGAKAWTHPVTGARMDGVPLYDGTVFHRTGPNFVVQGGDPFTRPDGDATRAGLGGAGEHVPGEPSALLRLDHPGLVAFANGGPAHPGTHGCQFFLTEVALPHLTGRHLVFGDIVDGFELVPKIARTPADRPVRLERIVVARGKF